MRWRDTWAPTGCSELCSSVLLDDPSSCPALREEPISATEFLLKSVKPRHNLMKVISILSTVSRLKRLTCSKSKLSTLKGLHGWSLPHGRILAMKKLRNLSQVKEKAAIIFLIRHPRRHLGFIYLCSLRDATIKSQAKLLRRQKKKISLWVHIIIYKFWRQNWVISVPRQRWKRGNRSRQGASDKT